MVDAATRLARTGFNRGTAGNVSLRLDNGFLITPSGMPPETILPSDIVFMEMDGASHGSRQP